MKPRWNVIGLAALLGCQYPATQLVLRVDSDMRAGDELRAVQVTMRRAGAAGSVFDRTYELGAGAYQLPGTLGVVPGDPDDPRQLEVDVRAVLRDAEGFNTRAIVSFQPGETLLLDLFLASRCRDPSNRAGCGTDETCGPAGCEPVARPALPDFSPSAPRRDGGAGDGVTSLDGGEPDAPTSPDVVEGGATDDAAVTDSGCGPGAGCCEAGVPCGVGSVCAALDGEAPRCAPCGASGQPCCAGGACAAAGSPCARASCDASGRCGSTAVSDGTSCGAVGYGPWDACAFSSTCDRSGTQRRSVSTPRCMAGACTGVSSTETQACSRSTDGVSCGATSYGAWGACGGFASTCDTGGTQTRAVTSYRCSGGGCGGSSSTGSQACTRTTTNVPCSWTLNGRACPGVCQVGSCSPTCGRPLCPC